MLKDGHKQMCGISCLSWTSVFSGALVAIGLSFLFNLFWLAVGLSAYTTAPQGHKILVAGGYLGIAAATMISMFIGGWVSGYLGKERCSNKKFGILYGFITWCIALVLSITLTANVGKFITIQQNFLAHHELVLRLSTSLSHSMNANTTENSSALNGNPHQLSKKETHAIGGSLLLTFLLFLVGAIMSGYGGYRGIKSKIKH